MHGITHVQLTINLGYEDGLSVSIATPVWRKDIRQGDFFADDEIENILTFSAVDVSNMVRDKTQEAIHKSILDKMSPPSPVDPKQLHKRYPIDPSAN